jgi:uncharacterized membrane protein YphA (DoxX/SURF4 family)
MGIALWIVQVLLALLFASTGATKLARDKAALVGSGMTWAEDRSELQLKLVGIAEIAGALGLVLPTALDFWRVLTPIAAFCLGVAMVVAAVIHQRRGESPVAPITLAVLAFAVALLRFGLSEL